MIRALFVYRYCTMGGVETGLRFRIPALARHGVEAHVLFLRDYGGRPAFADLDGRVFFRPDEAGFAELVARNQYDLISIIDSFEVFDWLERIKFGGRVMVELRSTYEHTLVQLKRLAGRRLDAILVPSEFQSQNVMRYLPRAARDGVPRHVVHNFVDADRFREVPGPTNGAKIVCWIGRIDPLKNWQEFLDIADRLSDRTDVEFWLVGGGRSDAERRDKFRKAVGQSRVAAKLRWFPLVANPDMPHLYSVVANSGGCVALTTKCESFGFAALEALACGCPVVASRVGGLAEVVEHGQSGLLYTLGQVSEAADAVATVLDDDGLRAKLVENGLRSVRERFDPKRCVAAFAQVIQTVCESDAVTAE